MYSYPVFKVLLETLVKEFPDPALFTECLLYTNSEYALKLYHELSKEYT